MNQVEKTLQDRGERYGTFASHAQISRQLKDAIQSTPKFKVLAADQQEALEMICHKIARILNGDPDYTDSWHDIAGYAQLVEKRLQGEIL